MKVPDLVTGDDELEKVGQCAAMHGGIAGESGKDFSGFEVPQLHRVVPRCRDRAPPVRCSPFRPDNIGVASEGAQFNPAVRSQIFSVLYAEAETARCPPLDTFSDGRPSRFLIATS